jgi:ribosome-associated protein
MPIDVRPGLTIPDSDLEFRASRSGGPGGQHVNTTASQVELRFDLDGTSALADYTKGRLREIAAGRISSEGVLRIVRSTHRSQSVNKEECLEALKALLLQALAPPPKKRRPTKPSKGAKRRRLDAKKQRGQVKKDRSFRGDY